MAAKPALHAIGLVRAVVVSDHVHAEVGGRPAVDHLQEAKPLLMTVTRRAHAEDLLRNGPFSVFNAAKRVDVPLRL